MLAHVLAAEMGVTFRKVAPGRLKPADVERAIFHESGDLTDHDVLLLEEAHAAFAGGETAMSWLLDTLTDFELRGNPIPKITFVLATHRGIRSQALASRLLEIRLEPYSHDEALELIAACSKELLAPFPPLTRAQANVVAKAACRNPRQIQAILRMLEALAGDGGDPATFSADDYDVDRALRLMGLSRDGLDRRARTYLAELLLGYGGVAGKATMQAHLGEPHLDDTEALLIGKGLLRRTRAGRELTRDGRRRAAGIVAGSRRHLEVAS